MKRYIVEVDENKKVYRNLQGQKHREDGPAVKWSNGVVEWWLNDQRLSEYDFDKQMNSIRELTVEDVERIVGHRVKIVKG